MPCELLFLLALPLHLLTHLRLVVARDAFGARLRFRLRTLLALLEPAHLLGGTLCVQRGVSRGGLGRLIAIAPLTAHGLDECTARPPRNGTQQRTDDRRPRRVMQRRRRRGSEPLDAGDEGLRRSDAETVR